MRITTSFLALSFSFHSPKPQATKEIAQKKLSPAATMGFNDMPMSAKNLDCRKKDNDLTRLAIPSNNTQIEKKDTPKDLFILTL
jgi:hypothetical protein